MVITKDKPIEVSDILNAVYPVGSIYMSVNNTSPESFIGGTWVALQDRFLIGAGNSYANGATGGEAEHTLTESELPSHNHNMTRGGRPLTLYTEESPSDMVFTQGFSGVSNGWWSVTNKNVDTIASTGEGVAHNNLPPYLAVYMWKRTA